MWCPAPLPEGELHRRKLRSDKYKPPAGHLLECYESDSSVETGEDTDAEADGDAGTGLGAGGAAKPQRRARSAVGKQSTSSAAVAVSAVKAAEKKQKRKRKATSPLAVVTPSIPTPRSREVAEDRPVRRSESPAAKRQRELVEMTSEDALRLGLETRQTAAATQAKMPATIRPRLFRPKLRIPVAAR
jgi:hypothetical protein